jgi:hypothetical protein
VSYAVQVSVSGYPGFAHVLSVNNRGRSSQVIAVAVAKECLSLAGILPEEDGAPTAIDRLDWFASSIAVTLYKPVPGKFTPPWRGLASEFHIGDLKQLLLGGAAVEHVEMGAPIVFGCPPAGPPPVALCQQPLSLQWICA